MARLRSSFVTVVTLCLVTLHLVVLPALYFGVGYLIRKSHEELFVQNARTFARVLADEFEMGAALESPARTADLLDLAIIHGDARFADIVEHDLTLRSQLGSPQIRAPRNTDLGYVRGGDETYFISLPIIHARHASELRLGFDERPTEARIAVALRRMLLLLSIYACVTLGIAFFLSKRLSRPIRRLRDASRDIASGDYAKGLLIDTTIRELHDLAIDFEGMRRELVGVNVRLQEQITEKESAELRRDALERQLRHRQRLETVGTLAGGIAHEFNNVLVPIILFTEAALKDLPPDSISRDDLERVLAASKRARNVVKKILTFSHVQGAVQLTAVDLRAVVNEGLQLFSVFAEASNSVLAEIDDDIPPVKADESLALDLMMNLCTNAYQSMQGAQGVLTIGLKEAQPEIGSRAVPAVELWVTDTGHGMDQATVERIFEPFFTTRAVGEGTGLGLAVVHGIVESFGATIKVDTVLGRGTTFRVLFPTIGKVPSTEQSFDAE